MNPKVCDCEQLAKWNPCESDKQQKLGLIFNRIYDTLMRKDKDSHVRFVKYNPQNYTHWQWLNDMLYVNLFIQLSPGGGGYLVQKTLQGCAANMGSKISLLVYEWPLIKGKIWYMNGSIFQNWPNLNPN